MKSELQIDCVPFEHSQIQAGYIFALMALQRSKLSNRYIAGQSVMNYLDTSFNGLNVTSCLIDNVIYMVHEFISSLMIHPHVMSHTFSHSSFKTCRECITYMMMIDNISLVMMHSYVM